MNHTKRIEELIQATLLLHKALKKAREEMPPCFVADQINYAEHRIEDALDCLRKAREWSEDEFMSGEKSLEEIMFEVGESLGRLKQSLGMA